MKPDEINAHIRLAGELLGDGRADAALEQLDEVDAALLEFEQRLEIGSLRAWALAQLGRSSEALELLAPLIDENPDSVRLHTTRGIVLMSLDRFDEACDALEFAVTLDPGDAVALANLGNAYENLREFDDALRTYRDAESHGADLIWLLQRRAAVYRETGDFVAARGTLRRYLSLMDEDGDAWVSLAIVLSELDDFESSFACYERASQLDPESEALHFNWGLTAERAGELAVARRELHWLEQNVPDSAQVRILRGYILERETDVDGAAEEFLAAVDAADPGDADELCYAYEQAMGFYADHRLRRRADALLRRAYADDACGVELCEAYRELTGERLASGMWYSILAEVAQRAHSRSHRAGGRADDARETAARTFQVVARDREHAAELLRQFLRQMGQVVTSSLEFADEERVEDVFAGIYEVEPVTDDGSRA